MYGNMMNMGMKYIKQSMIMNHNTGYVTAMTIVAKKTLMSITIPDHNTHHHGFYIRPVGAAGRSVEQ